MPCPAATPNPNHSARLLSASDAHLKLAATMLRRGRLLSFPTETVYGLGADATNSQAVRSIFAAKRRPPDNPLIVHIAHLDQLSTFDLTTLPLTPLALNLANKFWPGPLTIILPLSPTSPLSPHVTAGLDSVAIRIPQHPVARQLIQLTQRPIAAPSANLSGRPSPTTAMHVMNDLSDVIDAVIQPPPQSPSSTTCQQVGLESTVVDLTSASHPTVLRPGSISIDDLQRATDVQFYKPLNTTTATTTITDSAKPKAPGMKYRHYAPIAPLHIISNEQHLLKSALHTWRSQANCIGILADKAVCDNVNVHLNDDNKICCVPCGAQQSAASFGRELYAALRAFDGEGEHAVNPPVDVILAVPPDGIHNEGIGEAVMNRLRKAAAGREEDVPTS